VLEVASSPTVRSNLGRIPSEVRQNGGVDPAADAVEEFLSS
jgi:hypothetical protein